MVCWREGANRIVNGVLITRMSSESSSFWSRGLPSRLTSTAGSETKSIFGGSVLIFSATSDRFSTSSRVVRSRSMEMRSCHLGISFSSKAPNFREFCSSCSGNRTWVTETSAIVAMRSARSVSRRASNHTAPKTGSVDPLSSTATAARALSLFPSSFSGCGWYMTTTP
ncbi:hypothetical protein ES703_107126 [subsurface metagenome]